MAIYPKTSPPPTSQWPDQGQWTYEDWEQLPNNGARFEVIDGVLHMAPPPSIAHQSIVANLFTLMNVHSTKNNLGRVFPSPVGVRLPTQPVPLQPDIVFVSKERKDIIGSQYIEGVPDLVIEVLSPSNWPYDRNEKFQVYQTAGVPESWIVDYRARTVEVLVMEAG
jgi:Uma2 family endonuclease